VVSRKWAITYLLLLISSPLLCDELVPVVIRDFSAGLQTKRDPTLIQENAAQDLQNVDLHTGRLEKRRGSVLQNSSTLDGHSSQSTRLIHEFVDSSAAHWLITLSSNTLFKSSNGGVTNTVLTSTHGVTVNSEFSVINAFGKARLSDGTTNWILFDGTSVTVSTTAKKGRVTAFWSDRGWAGNVVGNESELFYSADADLEDWTNDTGLDSDAGSILIRKGNGDLIRALVPSPLGLLIFKDFSIDLLIAKSDEDTYFLTSVSDDVGTQYRQSVQVIPGGVIFLGHDGYYLLSGNVIRKISEIIAPTISSIIQFDSNQRSNTQTTQDQFGNGTLTNVSENISIGDVFLSTWTDTDTDGADFILGSITNGSTTTLPGSLEMAVVDSSHTNNDFENGSGGPCDDGEVATGWTFGGDATAASKCWDTALSGSSVQSGSKYIYYIGNTANVDFNNFRLLLLDDVGAEVIDSGELYASLTTDWQQFTLGASALKGKGGRFRFKANDGNSVLYLADSTNLLYFSGEDITFYAKKFSAVAGPNTQYYLEIDLTQGGVMSGTSTAITSQVFDTSISSPSWLGGSVSATENNNTVSWQVQVATSSTGAWDTSVTWTPGIPISSAANKRYVRYISTMSLNSNSSGLPSIQDVTLAARSLNGTFVTQGLNIGSSITSWDILTITDNGGDGGSLSYAFYTDTDTASGIDISDTGTFTSSQTITSGDIPSVATAAAAYVSSTFTITLATQSPAINQITLDWNEGNANFPISSVVYQGDYISSVAISSQTGNDTMFVFDRNGAWTKYSYPAYSMGLYRQKPYFGSALQGDIVRFQADGIEQDYDGSAVDAFWESKEFDFGFPVSRKTIYRNYITGQRIVDSDATFEYAMDRSTTTKSETLDFDSTAGLFIKTIKPTNTNFRTGINYRFKISDNEVGDNFSITAVKIVPSVETSP
jgi:hypothetical protein